MPTTNQLMRGSRQAKKKRSQSPHLNGRPQLAGTAIRVGIMKPKKPNSAERKIARARLTTGKEVTVYIPGEGTARALQEHSDFLIEGGGPPDLPGVKYTLVPGAKGTAVPGSEGYMDNVRPHRRNKSRSRYGVKRKKV